MNKIKSQYDLCTEACGIFPVVTVEPIRNSYLEVHKRGVKVRLITEITRENLAATMEAMKFAEVRHFDKTIGNFVIADGTDYAGAPDVANGVQQLIVCNIGSFVKQQQYLFDTLWEKSVPALERIRQLEEGIEPETLEVIPDVETSVSRAFSVMSRTKNELLALFATARTFHIAMSTEGLDIYRRISDNGVKVRILVPTGEGVEETVSKLRRLAPNVTVQVSDTNLNTKITIMVSDKSEFMSWELRDDKVDDPFQAGGQATYSNIKSLAASYATIIENLWQMSASAKELQLANIRLENSERVMKDFLNIAAHEMRTPLQPILGLSDSLVHLLPQLTGDTRNALEAISRNARRLELLVEQILDVTRIEGNMLKLNKQPTHLEATINEVAEDFRSRCEAKKIRLTAECEPGLFVIADEKLIGQVVSNLLSNALKFTSANGQITIIAQTIKDPGSEKARVSVIDDGEGIDPELLPVLFNKFVTRSESGHGLGLYICKGIVEAHGGTIWAANNKDSKGATFSFVLPMASE